MRLRASGQSSEAYLDQLTAGPSAELAALGRVLTTGETYFLRHLEQFRALTERVVPERLAAPGRIGELRVLSAGCSSGEEAYSLAIALRESGQPTAGILGVDLNPAAVERARTGRYTAWSLRSVPAELRRRWFIETGDVVELDPAVRERVRFQQTNLATDDPVLWAPESLDVVFCRNVLMYFAPDVMATVIDRFARALAPGGFLFLGSAETLRGMTTQFELCESHGTFYYRRRPVEVTPVAPATATPSPRRSPAPGPSVPHPGPAGPDRDPAPDAAVPSLELTSVLELIGQERFAEALSALDRLERLGPATGASTDPELLLLRAALLTHTGSYSAAAIACHRLLEHDRFAADAHALLAAGLEFGADLPAAIEHCRTATGCDPRFALAHLQLGRLIQRTGDQPAAHRHYSTAARLLAAETDRRILLFGGGFDRESLISLCRTQSAVTGGDR